MKILVPLKPIDGTISMQSLQQTVHGGDQEHSSCSTNPFCEVALEAACRIKESVGDCEIILLVIGKSNARDVLRKGLSLGGDRGVHVEIGVPQASDTLDIAKTIVNFALQEQPDLILMGMQAIDTDNGQVGQMVSTLLGWPQAVAVSKIEVKGNSIIVEKEIDDGLQITTFDFPAVLAVDIRLNEPRNASLLDVMQAQSKPLLVLAGEEVGYRDSKKIELKNLMPIERRSSLCVLSDVTELADTIARSLNN